MFSTIFTIAAVHLIALMSPGPDCFIVMQTAVGRSRKEALVPNLESRLEAFEENTGSRLDPVFFNSSSAAKIFS